MKTAIFLILFLLPAPKVSGAEPWETVVMEAVLTMNRGDGTAFVKWAHEDFKSLMRNLPMESLRKDPDSAGTKTFLAGMSVKTLAELEALDMDTYISRVIVQMHESQPTGMKASMKTMKLVAKRSEIEDGMQRVTVDATFDFEGKSVTREMVLYAKREGETWKYCGDAHLLRRDIR